MFEFINYLKVLATVLITNSHFGDIWPVSAIATGGLLGNVVFFAVSGFLLYNIKTNFPKWFSKRFFRVYPALAIFTLLAVCIGEYSLTGLHDAVRLFVYPTNYIFLVWLVVCYCVFYPVAVVDKKKKHFLEITMSVIFVLWIVIYAVIYDKSSYTVDNVSEPFILFLYIESMLLGALFNKYKSYFGKFRISKVFLTGTFFVIYAASKILFSKVAFLLPLQILNQFVILITLFFVFDLFMSMESLFKKIPKKVAGIVRHISNITLQIYVVQFVLIRYCSKIIFPLNLIMVTLAIIAAATVLYYVEAYARKAIGLMCKKTRKV